MTTDLTTWRAQLDERMRKQIAFAELYAREFGHGVVGHNDLVLIARLAELLDVAAGIRAPAQPPEPADLRLTFGKYAGRSLGELRGLDLDYLAWLAREARDAALRAAAQSLLAPPASPAGADAPAPEPDEPGVDIPF